MFGILVNLTEPEVNPVKYSTSTNVDHGLSRNLERNSERPYSHTSGLAFFISYKNRPQLTFQIVSNLIKSIDSQKPSKEFYIPVSNNGKSPAKKCVATMKLPENWSISSGYENWPTVMRQQLGDLTRIELEWFDPRDVGLGMSARPKPKLGKSIEIADKSFYVGIIEVPELGEPIGHLRTIDSKAYGMRLNYRFYDIQIKFSWDYGYRHSEVKHYRLLLSFETYANASLTEIHYRRPRLLFDFFGIE